MGEIYFGSNLFEQTVIVFNLVLVAFIVFPLSYQVLSCNQYRKLQSKIMIFDWRILIPILIYTILLGYRYNYSWDWYQYYNTFNYMKMDILFRDDVEIGYAYINKILAGLDFDFYSIFLVEAFVYVFALCYLLRDNRKYLLFSLPYVYISCFYNCLNISRQFFAISILYIAFRCYIDRKLLLALILAILGCSIHYSTILWIPLFYILSKVDKIAISLKKMLLILLVIAFFSYVFKGAVENFMVIFSSLDTTGRYSEAQFLNDRFIGGTVPVITYSIAVIKMILYLIVYKKIELKGFFLNNPTLHSFVLIGILAMPLRLLMGNNEILSRFVYNITIFIEFGWGILLYILYKEKVINNLVLKVTVFFFVIFHSIYAFEAQIIAYMTNVSTNNFIIYK